MSTVQIRVAGVGAGRWALSAHTQGCQRDPWVGLVALADTDDDYLRDAALRFSIDRLAGDYRGLVTTDDIDVADIATANHAHFEISVAALQSGKHVLREKSVHHDFHETQRLSDFADRQSLKTAFGCAFRYAPAVEYVRSLIDTGFAGTPLIFNGYEQNSQWVAPRTTEVLSGYKANHGDFVQDALVQQAINAFEGSYSDGALASSFQIVEVAA